MKIHFDIDCTPEEARAFFGLPDVRPMQEAVMGEMQARTLEAMRRMDPEAILKSWFPMSTGGLEQFQKAFWANLTPRSGEGS